MYIYIYKSLFWKNTHAHIAYSVLLISPVLHFSLRTPCRLRCSPPLAISGPSLPAAPPGHRRSTAPRQPRLCPPMFTCSVSIFFPLFVLSSLFRPCQGNRPATDIQLHITGHPSAPCCATDSPVGAASSTVRPTPPPSQALLA